MSLSKKLLRKEISSLALDDVKAFFKTEKEESDILEFKSFFDKRQNNIKEKEKGVIKTICGFLNSNGGLLIWGAPIGEKLDGRKEKVFSGELSPVKMFIEKDSFINKISNGIIPVPDKVQFARIPFSEDSFIYLIEVKESSYKPHQFDGRYYMRLDGQTKVAPHHYVEALFKQIRYPNLGGYLQFVSVDQIQRSFRISIRIYLFNHSPLQNEEKVSIMLMTSQGSFRDPIRPGLLKEMTLNYDGQQLVYNGFQEVFHYGKPEYIDVSLIISQNEIGNNLPIEMQLYFGGRYSPLKCSKYLLNIQRDHLQNPALNIIESRENLLMNELLQDPVSEKEKVDKILKRGKVR